MGVLKGVAIQQKETFLYGFHTSGMLASFTIPGIFYLKSE